MPFIFPRSLNEFQGNIMLVPQQKVPSLAVDTVTGERFDLGSEQSEFATLVCFYRGLHCPICATYLKELERLTPEFVNQGVSTIGISSDTLERASTLRKKIGAEKLRIGYGLSISDARKWGLYISAGIGKTKRRPPATGASGQLLHVRSGRNAGRWIAGSADTPHARHR